MQQIGTNRQNHYSRFDFLVFGMTNQEPDRLHGGCDSCAQETLLAWGRRDLDALQGSFWFEDRTKFSSCFMQFLQEFFNWLDVFDVFFDIQFLLFAVHISESAWFGLRFMWNHGILFSSGSASAAGPVGNPGKCILIWTLDSLADTSLQCPKMSTSYSSTWCTQIFIVRNEVTRKSCHGWSRRKLSQTSSPYWWI